MDLKTIFNNKRVLVTGSSGFKGSWLCLWLKLLGAHVYGISLLPDSEKGNYMLCDMESVIHNTYKDITSFSVKEDIERIDPEFVFHLAAQPLVLDAIKDPFLTYSTNVMGTVNLLESLRNLENVKSIVVVTSDKCYRNTGSILSEEGHLGGDDPYSASKACAEMVAHSYYKTFFKQKGVGLATARAGNVMGGGDRGKNRIIVDCVEALENNRDIYIRNPGHIRPWQYVLDPLYGYMILAAKLSRDPEELSSAWNFGPQDNTSITAQNLAEMLIVNFTVSFGPTKTRINLDRRESITLEKSFLSIDSNKSKLILGVSNIVGLHDMMKFTVEDYFTKEYFYDQRIDRILKYEESLKNEM